MLDKNQKSDIDELLPFDAKSKLETTQVRLKMHGILFNALIGKYLNHT